MSDEPDDKPVPEDPGASVLLMKTWSDGEAEVVRQLLASYGIQCQVVSDVTHAVLPLSVDGLGEIRILVPRSRLAEAETVLAEHRREGLEMMDGGREPPDDGENEPSSEGSREEGGGV